MLIQYNGQYLELCETRDRLFKAVGYLESEKYVQGRPYHLIKPGLEESLMITTLSTVEGLEGQSKLKLYLYIDDNFILKTKTYESTPSPSIDLEIDM